MGIGFVPPRATADERSPTRREGQSSPHVRRKSRRSLRARRLGHQGKAFLRTTIVCHIESSAEPAFRTTCPQLPSVYLNNRKDLAFATVHRRREPDARQSRTDIRWRSKGSSQRPLEQRVDERRRRCPGKEHQQSKPEHHDEDRQQPPFLGLTQKMPELAENAALAAPTCASF